jgi:hypothetical protein
MVHLLPNNVHRKGEQKADTALEDAILHSPRPDSLIAGKYPSSTHSSKEIQESPIALAEVPSLRGGGKMTGLPTRLMSISDMSRQTRKYRPVSSDIKSVTENAIGDDEYLCYGRAQTTDSVCMTPREYPSYHPPPPRQTTPYPQDHVHLPFAWGETNSCFPRMNSFSIAEKLIDGPCCEGGAPVRSPKTFQADSLSPEGPRDQPASKESSALPSSFPEYSDKWRYSSKRQIYKAPESEAILQKIKRQKAGKYNMTQGAEKLTKKTEGNRSKRIRLGSEEYRIDPRSEDLRKQ